MTESLPFGIRADFAERQDNQFLAAVAKMSSWDYSPIERQLAKRDQISADLIEASKLEFQRYFSSILTTNRRLAAPVQADIFWHAFINDTMQYEAFCKAVFGRFIHHVPGDYGDVRSPRNLEVVDRTVELFDEMFGVTLDVSPQPHPISTKSHSIECECGGEDGY